MIPIPENIKYQPASNIELVPIAYITGEPTGTGKIFPVSNVDGFLDAQVCEIIFPDGARIATAALAATLSVSKLNKTLTFTAAPALPTVPTESVYAGATIIGPPLVSLGGTNGGVTFQAKPDVVNVEIDQVEGDVDAIPVHWNVSAAFTLMEFSLDQWGYASQMGYSLRAASTSAAGSSPINSANIIDTATGRVQKFGARFTFDKQDPTVTTLKDKLLLYKVAAIDGVDTKFMKRDVSSLAVTFKGLADPARPRGKRFYQLIQELAAGT
jgi:hypothetical protein